MSYLIQDTYNNYKQNKSDIERINLNYTQLFSVLKFMLKYSCDKLHRPSHTMHFIFLKQNV